MALVGGGRRGRRGWRHLYGEECDLLLGCSDGGPKFCHACDCRLVVGIIRDLEVGQLTIEGGLDVIECIVIGNDVGGYPLMPVVPVPDCSRTMYAVVKCVFSASHVRAAAGMPFHSMRA